MFSLAQPRVTFSFDLLEWHTILVGCALSLCIATGTATRVRAPGPCATSSKSDAFHKGPRALYSQPIHLRSPPTTRLAASSRPGRRQHGHPRRLQHVHVIDRRSRTRRSGSSDFATPPPGSTCYMRWKISGRLRKLETIPLLPLCSAAARAIAAAPLGSVVTAEAAFAAARPPCAQHWSLATDGPLTSSD